MKETLTDVLPIELWKLILGKVDLGSPNRRQTFVPLLLVSKGVYNLVAPTVYNHIFVPLPSTLSMGYALRSPCTPIPPKRLNNLLETYRINPHLATYTKTLNVHPFFCHFIMEAGGWKALEAILPYLAHLERFSISPHRDNLPGTLQKLPRLPRLTHLSVKTSWDLEGVHRFLLENQSSLEFISLQQSFTNTVPSLSSIDPAGIDFPNLVTLEGAPYLWSALAARDPSHSSHNVIKHIGVELTAFPVPTYPPSILQQIQTLQVDYADSTFGSNVAPHLLSIELLRMTTRSPHDVSDVSEILKVPPKSLRYAYFQSNLPTSAYGSSVKTLFNAFPALVIVDLEIRLEDLVGERVISRFIREKQGGGRREDIKEIKIAAAYPDFFQSWWELVVGDVERTTAQLEEVMRL
ncbi:hypothetical protein ONZ45_g2897 [Pleurotus djamor]|nr:hypothetical protein ONZ45_g2897 [Pleurotus djamor]